MTDVFKTTLKAGGDVVTNAFAYVVRKVNGIYADTAAAASSVK